MTYRGGITGAGRLRRTGPAAWAIRAGFALATAMAIPACYRPSIVDGGLQCGPASACPDGYGCVNGHCRLGGIVSPPDSGADDMSQPIDMSCVVPVPGCTPSATGVCDPVCQTGCACGEKCSVSGAGEPACVPVRGQAAETEPCNVYDYGAPGQTDSCGPGDVCLYPGGQGTLRAYCFALCTSDDTCPNSGCVLRAVAPSVGGTPAPTASVCDTSFTPTPCNPFDNTGCSDPDRPYCYLAPPDPVTGASRTQCEYAAGSKSPPDTCTWSRECFPRFACPQKGAVWPGAGFCLLVCDTAHPCGSGGTCKLYGSTYGYCVPA